MTADRQLALAATTINGLRAELACQRRAYAALSVVTKELAGRCDELEAELARAERLIAELRDTTSVVFDAGLGIGRSASVAELLGGRWTRN
jgi:hypothetical protein